MTTLRPLSECSFNSSNQLGVRPYYIYHCQQIQTTERFVMTLEDEVEIMSTLRERLSGLAFPQHVIDLPSARGKVLLPTNHWSCNLDTTRDFDGIVLDTSSWTPAAKGEARLAL